MKFLLATLCLLTAALNCEALQRKEAPPLKLHSVFDAPATPPQSIFWSAQSGAEATSHSYPGGRDDYNKRIIAYSLIGAFGLFFIAGFLLMVHAGDVATQAGHPGDATQLTNCSAMQRSLSVSASALPAQS